MRFEFFPLRFEFAARDSLFFAPGKAGNILRGAFGVIFRQLACVPGCTDARGCERRDVCQYARVFAPGAGLDGPSGLGDPARPFVFRARHLDGVTIRPGQLFYFDVHVFGRDAAMLSYFVRAFAELACAGLGPRRGKADLNRVSRIAVGDVPEEVLSEDVEPAWLELDAAAGAPHRIRVEFLSPTELKYEQRIVDRPEFPILFGRIRDRIGTLRSLYGPGPLEIDFQESGMRAAAVRMPFWEGRRIEVSRRSSRTGQNHSIGGFTGIAEYEGNLAEFLPYLEAARWTGVGRQSVWGKGEISVVAV